MATTAQKINKKDKFIGVSNPANNQKALDKIVQSRITLMWNHPFFGHLITRMRVINGTDWLPTAATDGKNLYYNENFINLLNQNEVTFLLAHEVFHVVYDHLGRNDSRDRMLFNVAADFCVNRDLKEMGIGQFITSVPCLYDKKYDKFTAEQVYDDLYNNAEKIDINDLIEQMLDDHLDDDSNDSDDEGDDSDGKGKRPKLTQEDRDAIREEMKQAIVAAAQQAGTGKLPAGIARLVGDIVEPIMPWKELIQSVMTSHIKTESSWNRPSRRSAHLNVILPSAMPGEEIDIAVALDMSGSISTKEANIFVSEVKNIMQMFDAFKVHIFCFDTAVYNPADYSSLNMDSMDDYEPKGGGGTCFECIFDHLKQRETETKSLIVFTDGYPNGSWGDKNYCDTTWVMHGTKIIKPPFGKWAYYDEYE